MPGPTPPFRSGSTINFYAGSKLNRFSWLRNSTDFINGAITSPSARFILLNKLNPLVHKSAEGTKSPTGGQLATLGWGDVRETVRESIRLARGEDDAPASAAPGDEVRVFGPEVLGLQGPSGADAEAADIEAAKKQFEKATESMGPTNLVLVFLGVDESATQDAPSAPGQVATKGEEVGAGGSVEEGKGQQLQGVPYFALSVSHEPHRNHHLGSHHHHHHEQQDQVPLPTHKLREDLLATGKYEFVDTRSLAQAASWPAHHAAMLAQARSLVDWNERMAVILPGLLEAAVLSVERAQEELLGKGHLRSVLSSSNPTTNVLRPFLPSEHSPSTSPSFDKDGKVWPCPATQSLSNFSYPRTDSVVIMGVLNRTGDKILLGRQRTWPKKMYSCLAGFLEAGEALEEAVKREIYEEAAIEVEEVVYHSSQPWPFPANLMIGCFAICKSDRPENEIRLDLDNELEDARFFTREEVLEVIDSSANRIMTKRDVERYEAGQNRNVIGPKSSEQKTTGSKVDEKGQWKKTDGSASESEEEGVGKAGPKWNKKDEGSVANVRADGARAPRTFAIPASTAIAHVLISSWARGEAYIPSLSKASRM
ncbi:NADH pyrophosphatase [Tilletia horrida]|nr:NADH pyrophosphatase [Tilletia horrida]